MKNIKTFLIAAVLMCWPSLLGSMAHATTPSVPSLFQQVPIGQIIQVPVAIANSGTTSVAITAHGMELVAIQLPATMTSTALTFTASVDGVTYQPLYNSSGAVSYTIAGARYLAINPADFAGVAYFKIVCGSSEGAARALTAVMKGI